MTTRATLSQTQRYEKTLDGLALCIDMQHEVIEELQADLIKEKKKKIIKRRQVKTNQEYRTENEELKIKSGNFQKTIEELKKNLVNQRDYNYYHNQYHSMKEGDEELKKLLEEKIKELQKKLEYRDEEIEELKEELMLVKKSDMWKGEEIEMIKKYKHLDFDTLLSNCWEKNSEFTNDYWDMVVQEHGLLKYDKDGVELPTEKQDKPEYIKFCKYFPRQIYDNDSNDSDSD